MNDLHGEPKSKMQIYSNYSDICKFNISQGSVATQLRCGGMFSNHFIANFPQNMPVEKNLKIGQY